MGKSSTIQNGCRKLGNHARVFSQTLANGNSKNEIRYENRQRREEERREYRKKKSGHEKNKVPTAIPNQNGIIIINCIINNNKL